MPPSPMIRVLWRVAPLRAVPPGFVPRAPRAVPWLVSAGTVEPIDSAFAAELVAAGVVEAFEEAS